MLFYILFLCSVLYIFAIKIYIQLQISHTDANLWKLDEILLLLKFQI